MAYENDILTRNDNDELAVRTVQSVGDNPASSYDDVYTRDNNGKLAVRVVGSGGGDSHNKGYFATQAALEEAYPTGEAGDYAIVGSTDTVWIWDDDNSEWVDTDTKGEVTSVNGQTGVVVLDADDVGAVSTTPYEYTAELEFTPNVDTEGAIIIELAGDNVATLQIGQYVSYEDGGVWDDPVEDAVYTAFMQPSLDTSVGASKILWTSPASRLIYMEGYAGTGQDGQSILNIKYLYNDSALAEDHCKIVLKILSDKELTITATKDPSEFITDASAGIMSLPIPLYEDGDQTQFYPVQQGGSISWEPIPQSESLPSQTGNAGKFLKTDGTDASWGNALENKSSGTQGYAIGDGSSAGNYAVALGSYANASGINAVAIGSSTTASATNAIQIGGSSTNSNANTLKVGNANGNFEMMSADGTIPEARLADTTNAAQGQVLTLDSNLNAVWQASSGGGLPSQTGNSGKFLTTDGTDASWSDKPLVNMATSADTIAVVRNNASINSRWSVIFNTNQNHGASSAGSIVMGYSAKSTNYYSLVFGFGAVASGYQSMAFGYGANVSGDHSIQFGNGSNSENNTMKVSFGNDSSDPNYTLLVGDGTIPEARLADTTNAQQGDVLTLDSNGNAVWQAGGGGGGSQIQYSTMPDAEQNAGRIVQYIGDSAGLPPAFTIETQSPDDMITISDPTAFLNAVNNSGTGSFVAGYYVELTASETGGTWDIGVVLYNNEGTDIGYGSIITSSPETDCGITIQGLDPTWRAAVTCNSVGSSSNYMNGYFYKSVSGGVSGLQFVCDTTKIEVVDPTLFITSANNAMQGGTQIVDGTYFDITCNMSGSVWSISISIQAPDGQGGILEDSGEINTSDPATDAGLSIITQSNFFQTYASYTSTPSEPQIYNWNPNDLTITNAQTFLGFCNNITTVGAQYTVNLEITQTGAWEVRINIADENGSQVADTMVLVQDLNTEVGISVNSNQVNASQFIISTGGATGYQWQQVNVQPITADSIAPTTGLTDGIYKLQLTITDGVPTLSWVAEQ